MKKIIRYLLIIFCLYEALVFYVVSTNKYFSYDEMDDNHDGLISPGELMLRNSVGTMVSYIDDTNTSCIFEVFTLKDVVPIKEFPMDCNSTVYPVPPSEYHYDMRNRR
jgi:hypothetical protein